MKRIPELDGLRGLAIAMVLMYHYGGWDWGWTGVDLFFVLSGFLIGGILIDAKGATNYYSVFYTRRAYRILPLYAITVAALPLLLTTHYPWFTYGNRIPWYAYATFTQNIWMAHLEKLGTMALAVTWSLAIEEQFYLTLPLLVRSVSRTQLIRVCCYCIALAPLLRLGVGLLYPHNWIALWALMPMRVDALFAGVLAACIMRDYKLQARIEPYRSWAFVIAALGVAVLHMYATSVDNPIMQTIGYTWVALFYTLLLLSVVIEKDSLAAKFMRMKWLGALGTLAYGIYLLHEIVIGLLFGVYLQTEPNVDNPLSILLTLCALVITIVIAMWSWSYLEEPMIKRHRVEYNHEMVRVLALDNQSVVRRVVPKE